METKQDINKLIDDLASNTELQKEWELNPEKVAANYELKEEQIRALLEGDVDALIAEGLAERHVKQMRVSW